MARAGPAASQASPVTVRKDGWGPSVTREPTILASETSEFQLLAKFSKNHLREEGRSWEGREVEEKSTH